MSSSLAALAGVGAAGGGAGSMAGSAAGSSSSAAAAAAAAAAAYMLPLGAPRPHRALWVAGPAWVAAALVDRDVEVYALFDPLTEREAGWKVLEGLRKHFGDKLREQEQLLPHL